MRFDAIIRETPEKNAIARSKMTRIGFRLNDRNFPKELSDDEDLDVKREEITAS